MAQAVVEHRPQVLHREGGQRRQRRGWRRRQQNQLLLLLPLLRGQLRRPCRLPLVLCEKRWHLQGFRRLRRLCVRCCRDVLLRWLLLGAGRRQSCLHKCGAAVGMLWHCWWHCCCRAADTCRQLARLLVALLLYLLGLRGCRCCSRRRGALERCRRWHRRRRALCLPHGITLLLRLQIGRRIHCQCLPQLLLLDGSRQQRQQRCGRRRIGSGSWRRRWRCRVCGRWISAAAVRTSAGLAGSRAASCLWLWRHHCRRIVCGRRRRGCRRWPFLGCWRLHDCFIAAFWGQGRARRRRGGRTGLAGRRAARRTAAVPIAAAVRPVAGGRHAGGAACRAANWCRGFGWPKKYSLTEAPTRIARPAGCPDAGKDSGHGTCGSGRLRRDPCARPARRGGAGLQTGEQQQKQFEVIQKAFVFHNSIQGCRLQAAVTRAAGRRSCPARR